MQRLFAALVTSFAVGAASAAAAAVIDRVAVDRHTFNPSANDSVVISVHFAAPGRASIDVVDRDGYVVRHLVPETVVESAFSVGWNGRDDQGAIVPDEAYSLYIRWSSGERREAYFPAATPHDMVTVAARYYDRRGGTLAYTLTAPSRVHVQAGTTLPRARANSTEGVVMKTIVNRAPRAAGAIAEPWNGFDESGNVYLPDLPNFVIAIAATPLPDNSIIAIGNRNRTFVEAAGARRGPSLLAAAANRDHAHHAGLDVFDDVSPDLRLEVVNGHWSAQERSWIVNDKSVRVRAYTTGPTAQRFRAQPGILYSYVDSSLFSKSAPEDGATIVIPASRLRRRVNLVTLNWSSKYGGVAANTVRVRIAPPSTSGRGGGR
jgi:flagellar hook assembly protein FlgD